MKIKKILNNNAVISENENREEIIVLGRAIAYGRKKGDLIDSDMPLQIYELSVGEKKKRIINLLKDIPIEYLELSDEIMKKARKEIPGKIDKSLYIALTDHINTSIERYKENLPLKNQLLFEIKHFYPKEFEIGCWALERIENLYGIKMLEDEARFIALHIVANEIGKDIPETFEITNFINSAINFVKYYFNVELDEDSLAYYRFVIHLKFFAQRMFNNTHKPADDMNNDLLEVIKEKYVQPYFCASKLKEAIEDRYKYRLDSDELLYLTIHIAKLVNK